MSVLDAGSGEVVADASRARDAASDGPLEDGASSGSWVVQAVIVAVVVGVCGYDAVAVGGTAIAAGHGAA